MYVYPVPRERVCGCGHTSLMIAAAASCAVSSARCSYICRIRSAVMSATAAQALAEGRLREVLPQWRYTGSYQGAAWLLWRQNLHLPPKQRVLIDYLSEALTTS